MIIFIILVSALTIYVGFKHLKKHKNNKLFCGNKEKNKEDEDKC